MEDKEGQQDPNQHVTERSEPVRSRWTPKPEQILILESIFNSGMVNPPKDETVRIRKLLEKFGSVGDANVFYWFQNRRSRSRRRQRQLQASLAASGGDQRTNTNVITNISPQALNSTSSGGSGAIHQYMESGSNSNYVCVGLTNSPTCLVASSPTSYLLGSPSSSCGVVGDNCMGSLFPQMGFQDIDQQSSGVSVTHPIYCPSSDTSNFHYQAGLITVFINGVATEVSRGALDIRAMFGQDVILVHSSGFPIPTNEFGFLMQSLQHGESYFLVSSRPT